MTAAVAWFALGVSMLSLTWQVVTWLRSGARARPESGTTVEQTGHHARQYYAWVSVANRGRLSTSVQEMGFALPRSQLRKGERHSGYNIDVDKTLPSRLEPGDRIKLQREWTRIESWLEGRGAPPDTRLRPYAVIGGRTVYGEALRADKVRLQLEKSRLEHEHQDAHADDDMDDDVDDRPDRRRMIG